jgi:hypothetical protein
VAAFLRMPRYSLRLANPWCFELRLFTSGFKVRSEALGTIGENPLQVPIHLRTRCDGSLRFKFRPDNMHVAGAVMLTRR